ncbi:hypothetical protein HY251_03045 [bacterium]|nr:hypothetical protein [bacterium]
MDALAPARASDSQVERLCAFLSDPDALVRAGVASAIGSVPDHLGMKVAASLVRALALETDERAASALIDSTLRTARAEAGSFLALAGDASVVRSTPLLAKRVAAYRDSLVFIAAGQNEPQAIIDRTARAEALAAGSR